MQFDQDLQKRLIIISIGISGEDVSNVTGIFKTNIINNQLQGLLYLETSDLFWLPVSPAIQP